MAGREQPGFHHLGLEGEADPKAGQQQVARVPVEDGGHGGVGRQEHEQDHQRVGHVASVESHGRR